MCISLLVYRGIGNCTHNTENNLRGGLVLGSGAETNNLRGGLVLGSGAETNNLRGGLVGFGVWS